MWNNDPEVCLTILKTFPDRNYWNYFVWPYIVSECNQIFDLMRLWIGPLYVEWTWTLFNSIDIIIRVEVKRLIWSSDFVMSRLTACGTNFKPSEKILKIGLAVWIFCGSCLDMKYQRIWITRSVWKKPLKTRNIAVIFILNKKR